MNHLSTQLTGKGILGLFIGCILSGTSLADVAGRVNFVSGNVQAISADGSRRALIKGELVNSGERLETNRGRIQIRFTDGSFISLQPNTVFGLDKYNFDKNKPEDGSLLFNFLRGGMRTVSGAIGKVNRANYKVQTPVATIGIRGTSYAANQEPNGRLLLTVGSGIVNLENGFGSSNVNVGQTFQVNTDTAPSQAPAGTSVSTRADSPESLLNSNKIDIVETKKPDTAIGDQVTQDGSPLAQTFIQLRDGIPRLSSFGSLLSGNSGVKIYPNVIGLYSNISENGQDVGNLVGLIGTNETSENVNGALLLDTRKATGGLQFVNVKQIGSLSFGEWTNGTAKLVNPFIGTVEQLTLSDKQFMPYIVGTTAEKNLGNNMKVSYILAGGTPTRAGSDIGTLNKLNIDIDLNLLPQISIDMAATLSNVIYSAKINNYPILDISYDKKFSGFILSGENDNFYATSSVANICANQKCPINLSAFLSSNDLGVVYEISRGNLVSISGVAALTGTESTVTPVEIANPLPSSLDNNYSALFSYHPIVDDTGADIPIANTNNLSAVFDSQNKGLIAAFHTVNQQAQDFYGALGSIEDKAASVQDVGHVAKALSWGRWTNGRLATGNDNLTISLSANDNIHYLIGLPTPTNTIPNIGSVTYSLAGGTASAIFSTTNNTAFDVGRVSNGSLAVDFGTNSTNLSLEISGFTKANTLQSLQLNGGGLLSSNALSFGDLSVTANANTLACTACTASVQGMFFGAVSPIANSQISAPAAAGITYQINGTIEGTQTTTLDVNGTAAFANPTLPAQNNQGT